MLAEAATSSESEARALPESGWWSAYTNNTENHCSWPGVIGNDDGRVTMIQPPDYIKVGNKFGNLNFSSFPDVVRLGLSSHGLSGSLPPQVASFSNLKCPLPHFQLSKW
ncbi:hypothetical protein SLA2020_147100 [Shorea laevis]